MFQLFVTTVTYRVQSAPICLFDIETKEHNQTESSLQGHCTLLYGLSRESGAYKNEVMHM